MFSTCMTTMRDFGTEWYRKWRERLAFPDRIHRKSWEIAIISETLESHGMLQHGKHGVGFGVGSEPLVKYYADLGPTILATDLLPDDWHETHKRFFTHGEHPNVSNRIVDMNWIDGAGGKDAVEEESADFTWSVCSMDHCGTAWWTKRFVLNQMNCLKPGGIGVHTGEYTINPGMPREGGTVWLNCDDLIDLSDLLRSLGHEPAPIDWFIGDAYGDHTIDYFPYEGFYHIKTEANGKWGTCFCFAVRKQNPGVFWVPLDESQAREAITVRASAIANQKLLLGGVSGRASD